MNELEIKANKLLDLLIKADINNLDGLRDISFSVDDNSRCGLSGCIGNFQKHYPHFFFLIDDVMLYFSKDIILIRNREHDERLKMDFDELLDTYLQVITTMNIPFSLDFYQRLNDFCLYFRWEYSLKATS